MGKKIIERTHSPFDVVKVTLFLNNRYEIDGKAQMVLQGCLGASINTGVLERKDFLQISGLRKNNFFKIQKWVHICKE